MRQGTQQPRERFHRVPGRGPRGTHEVVEYLFRHHFDEVVEKLGRHPHTRGTSRSYREGLASEVLKRMLESQQFDRYESGAVGTWIVQAVYRHRNEADRLHTRLAVTEGELEAAQAGGGSADHAPGLDAFEAPSDLEPSTALDDKQRDLAALELRAQLPEELQQLYQLRWEQGVPPRRIRDHFGWSRKQYEKRDAKLKTIVMTAVEQSVPDSIVVGRGDGTVCRQTRELLPLVFREAATLNDAERLRVDAHLLACHSCQMTARRARHVLAEARPLFVPVDPGIGGGVLVGGGLLADLWAKGLTALGIGGGGGAAAVKVVGVAGCAAACLVGGNTLRERVAGGDGRRSAHAAAVKSLDRPAPDRSRPASAGRTPTASPKPSLPSSTPQTRRRPRRPARSAATAISTTPAAVRKTEFLPEAPSSPPATAATPSAAAPSAAPSSGAEFAGP